MYSDRRNQDCERYVHFGIALSLVRGERGTLFGDKTLPRIREWPGNWSPQHDSLRCVMGWYTLIILPIDFISEANRQFMSALTVFVTLFVFIPAMIYFHVTVYREVRRNTKQIIATHVSLKAKAKLLKNRKFFYTTTIILFAIVVCYILGNVWIVIVAVSKSTIPVNVRHVVFNATSSLLVLNSLLNPLIYAVWIRCFRVAFIQLLWRKTLSKAQELEQRIFGSRQSGAGAITNITNQQQNKANGDDEVKEATLDNVQETQFNEHNSGPVQQRVGNQVGMLWIINFQFLKRSVFTVQE